MDNTNDEVTEQQDQTTDHSHDNGHSHDKNSSDPSLKGSAIVSSVETDPPDHTGAMARVFMDGLSLLCFNPPGVNNQRAELGFINAHHELIKMYILRNETSLIWSSEERADFPFPSTKNITITVNANKTLPVRRYEGNINDKEDFRHIPNLAELHIQRKFTFRENARQGFNARVNIQDAVFYTHLMSQSMATFYRKLNGRKTPHQRKYIGRIIGADIFSEQDIVIRINIPGVAEPYDVTLPYDDGRSKYSIVIRTVPHGMGVGHMERIYTDVIANPSDEPEFDIEFDRDESAWYALLIGDNRSYKLYAEGTHQRIEIPNLNQVRFNNIDDAQKAGYTLEKDLGIKATKFACEGEGGGEGPLPDPPEAP